jgi:Flp pilus assembly protein TadG
MTTRRSEGGQALVEFAISAVLLVLIFLGVFDLGRVFNSFIVITNAAREGAHYGALHPDDLSGIELRTLAEAQGSGVALSTANVSISTTGEKGTPIVVGVYYDFRLFSGVVPGISTIRLRSRAEMVIH